MYHEIVTLKVAWDVAFDVYHTVLKYNIFHASTRIRTIEETENGYIFYIPEGIEGDYIFKIIHGDNIQTGIIQDNIIS